MPRSARTSSSGRGVPPASTRATTSVDMASATTSWITVPITISMPPSTKISSGGRNVIHLPAPPASVISPAAVNAAPIRM
jgi:hypothetical protein